jgi:selenocysteine lyase/cysteine desulfurase
VTHSTAQAPDHSARFPGVVAARRDGRVLADNGAGAQVPREALDAVARFLELDNANKGAPFARKLRTSAMIAEAKDAFADVIGVPHGTIGLGLNATSIAFDIARCLAHTIRPGDRIVVTDADHFANVVPWTWLARFGAEIDRIPVDARGELDEAAYASALAKEPVIVALPWASNATGSIFDVARLAAAAKEAGAIVAVDGVQAGPHLRIDVPEAVDALYFSCYKMYAPHFGAWYAHPEFARRFFTSEVPQIPSAPFYWSMETGNQNHEGLAGWLGTIDYLRSIGDGDVRIAMDRIATHERELTRSALHAFAERRDRISLYGRTSEDGRLPVFSFNLRGEAPDAVARVLDAAGIEASAGNYYSPRLLEALTPETNGIAVRFSFAHYNDIADVDRCFAALDSIVGATV